MIALYNALLSDGLSSHMAWRVAFVVVPVPILLAIATAILVFGTDHPAGKWSDRHTAIVHQNATEEQNRVIVDEKGLTTHGGTYHDTDKQDEYSKIHVTVGLAQGSVEFTLGLSYAHQIDACHRDRLCRE